MIEDTLHSINSQTPNLLSAHNQESLYSIFHGPKEGLIDIKPVEIPFKVPIDFLFFPLLIIAVGLFIYIIVQSLRLRHKKLHHLEPIKNALLKLDNYPTEIESPKVRAEYLTEVLKSYLHGMNIKEALSIESSISIQNLSRLLNKVISGSSEIVREDISRDIISVLLSLEKIEYAPISSNYEQNLDLSLHKIREIITNIDSVVKEMKSRVNKNRKGKVHSKQYNQESRR